MDVLQRKFKLTSYRNKKVVVEKKIISGIRPHLVRITFFCCHQIKIITGTRTLSLVMSFPSSHIKNRWTHRANSNTRPWDWRNDSTSSAVDKDSDEILAGYKFTQSEENKRNKINNKTTLWNASRYNLQVRMIIEKHANTGAVSSGLLENNSSANTKRAEQTS